MPETIFLQEHSCQTLDVEIKCGLVEWVDLVQHEYPLFIFFVVSCLFLFVFEEEK